MGEKEEKEQEKKETAGGGRKQRVKGQLVRSPSCLLSGFNKRSGSVASGGFTAKSIPDPQQQVVDACSICVHPPIISGVVCYFVWNRMCYLCLSARTNSLKTLCCFSKNASHAFQRKTNRQLWILQHLFCESLSSDCVCFFFWSSASLMHLISIPQSRPLQRSWTATWRNRNTCGRITHPTSWQRRLSMQQWQRCSHTALSAPSSVHTPRYSTLQQTHTCVCEVEIVVIVLVVPQCVVVSV